MPLNELMESDIYKVWKDSEKYYVKLKSDDFYDDSMYVVLRKTGDVSYLSFVNFMIFNKNTCIMLTPEEGKEELNKLFLSL